MHRSCSQIVSVIRPGDWKLLMDTYRAFKGHLVVNPSTIFHVSLILEQTLPTTWEDYSTLQYTNACRCKNSNVNRKRSVLAWAHGVNKWINSILCGAWKSLWHSLNITNRRVWPKAIDTFTVLANSLRIGADTDTSIVLPWYVCNSSSDFQRGMSMEVLLWM